jgi:excinuclease ABC subunit A
VGTVTEIYDYLRVLFANIGKPHCPICGKPLEGLSPQEVLNKIFQKHKGKKVIITAPVVRGKKGEFKDFLQGVKKLGYSRVRVDGEIYRIEDVPPLEKNKKHDIEIVIDRLTVNEENKTRLLQDIEKAFEIASGLVKVLVEVED